MSLCEVAFRQPAKSCSGRCELYSTSQPCKLNEVHGGPPHARWVRGSGIDRAEPAVDPWDFVGHWLSDAAALSECGGARLDLDFFFAFCCLIYWERFTPLRALLPLQPQRSRPVSQLTSDRPWLCILTPSSRAVTMSKPNDLPFQYMFAAG